MMRVNINNFSNIPFHDTTGLDHLNTELVCYSDPHYIKKSTYGHYKDRLGSCVKNKTPHSKNGVFCFSKELEAVILLQFEVTSLLENKQYCI